MTPSPVTEGSEAPAFTLPDQEGEQHTLSDYRGRWVLLYFYPKDDTTGCTKEACMIRDVFPRFENLRTDVFGISKDSIESHKKFADTYDLPFPLLADVDGTVVSRYGVWREKKIFGKIYMGIARTSFLLDPEGKVAKKYEKVTPETHAEEVLADLKELGAGA